MEKLINRKKKINNELGKISNLNFYKKKFKCILEFYKGRILQIVIQTLLIF